MLRINWIAAWAALIALSIGGVAVADDETNTKAAADSSKWLGVMCTLPQAALRAQLALPADEGLLVMDVVPDSPAAEAGIQKYDVLLKANNQPLTSVEGLSETVEQNETVKLELLRAGKKLKVEATPAARPDDQNLRQLAPGPDRRGLRELFDQVPGALDLGPDGARRFRFRFFHPGQILGEGLRGDWPADLSVSVAREGDKPLKITVRRGDQQWEITREELGNLPEKIRPFVQRMLDGNGPAPPLGLDDDVEIELPQVQLPDFELPKVAPPEAPEFQNIEKEMQRRLEEINRQLKELQEQFRQRQDANDTDKPQA